MPYLNRSTDSLHGDEPEYERLAAMAEAGRDVDAEIDRKQAMMDAEDAKRAEERRLIKLRADIRYQAAGLVSNLAYLIKWSDASIIIGTYSADDIVKQAERLQALCREMAK